MLTKSQAGVQRATWREQKTAGGSRLALVLGGLIRLKKHRQPLADGTGKSAGAI